MGVRQHLSTGTAKMLSWDAGRPTGASGPAGQARSMTWQARPAQLHGAEKMLTRADAARLSSRLGALRTLLRHDPVDFSVCEAEFRSVLDSLEKNNTEPDKGIFPIRENPNTPSWETTWESARGFSKVRQGYLYEAPFLQSDLGPKEKNSKLGIVLRSALESMIRFVHEADTLPEKKKHCGEALYNVDVFLHLRGEPDPAVVPTDNAGETAREAKKKPATINQQMLDLLQKRPETRNWTARQFQDLLGCSVSTVHGTAAWEEIQKTRKAAKLERKERKELTEKNS